MEIKNEFVSIRNSIQVEYLNGTEIREKSVNKTFGGIPNKSLSISTLKGANNFLAKPRLIKDFNLAPRKHLGLC